YLGQTLDGHNKALPVQIAASLVETGSTTVSPIFSYVHGADFSYNYEGDMLYIYKDDIYVADGSALWNDLTIWNKYETSETLDTLYLLFHTADATERIVSSEAIKDAMEDSLERFGGEKVQGAEGTYSEKIFESVDEAYTKLEKTADDSVSLEAEIITQSWYEKLWGLGGSGVEIETIYSDLKCIYRVKDTDITGDAANDCAKLCIAKSDYDDFCAEYERAKENNETLYLFRYQVSDYMSQTATILGKSEETYAGKTIWCAENTPQGYFFKQTVNLDLDIIDVTLKDEDGASVFAVVSDPIDHVPDGTPPQDPTYKEPESGCNADIPWWVWLILGLVALLIVGRWVPPIYKGIKIVLAIVTVPVWGPIWAIVKIVRKIRGDDKW
ncbi:MAG: hypothetical protein IJ308_08875, partial [Clostridia bacterium]|nr:hypothetical protein [Clostridia bacterium]